MPVELEGSCHCGAIRFTVQSHTPVPYQLCTCSICRKVGGYSGSVNLGADFNTLNIIQGKEELKVYQAVMDRGTKKERTANSERNFCGKCSSMLWLWDSHWPDLCHPFASAIDSELKAPEEMVTACDSSRPAWVRLPEGNVQVNKKYGKDTIEDWHKKHGEYVE